MTQEALKLALEALEGMYIQGFTMDNSPINNAITAIKEALAQPEQAPVAWVDPTTLHHLKIGLEDVHLVYETEMVNSLPLYDKPQFQNPKQCLERLIRIMGTFDLATGHAETFDELLNSLESELRDVLGHYRAAFKEHLTQEPVAMLERDPSIGRLRVTYEDAVTELDEGMYPLYTKPPQRTWVGLEGEEIRNLWEEATKPDRSTMTIVTSFARAIEAKLKDKNCVG